MNQAEKERWGGMMEEYFRSSTLLRHALQLVDIRHEPSADDTAMAALYRSFGIPFTVVATKADKISRGARMKHLAPICRAMQKQPWEIIPFSAETGAGREELLAQIGTILTAQPD